ncbi:Monooxygenase, FAD-binding protein [Corchorus olitorius]|uniref:Monooxygenase, FAD-binding protein n=1 Tax=Corchorus olitorius TaxID=93759 RepID=A0A1R3IDL9_9ROSI|nr:Monooxygenase, FAD-binding protein [Corchorus olitorius]
MIEKKSKAKAIIVGGSIAGASCAHALTSAGWEVVVLEKTCAPPTGSPTGAGLGLDPLSQRLISSWLGHPHLLHQTTLPLTIDQNQATDSATKVSWTLTRDEEFHFRAAHWADLHGLLYNALPENIFFWGHQFISFSVSEDKAYVKVKAKVLKNDEIIEIDGNLLVAADGIQVTVHGEGFLTFQEKRIQKSFKQNSVTMKVSEDMINVMIQEAEKVWVPELVRVMKETKNPFLNAIYDCDPLRQLFWDNVVLIGDAAHPTTPHGLRSTNMSILDAAVLGKCLEKWGIEDLPSALEEYQTIRLPVTSKQVLHSRMLGRIKQGFDLPNCEPFDPKKATPEDCKDIQQKNMPFFTSVPSLLDPV